MSESLLFLEKIMSPMIRIIKCKTCDSCSEIRLLENQTYQCLECYLVEEKISINKKEEDLYGKERSIQQ